MKIEIKFNRFDLLKLAERKEKALNEAISETIEETSGKDEIQEGYLNSKLRYKSGYLYGSFRVEKTLNSIKVFSNVVYSRIQDLGGWAGRNHASYIPPTYYFTNGAKILKDKFNKLLRKKIREKVK